MSQQFRSSHERLDKALAASRAYATHVQRIEDLTQRVAECVARSMAAFEYEREQANTAGLTQKQRAKILRHANVWRDVAENFVRELEEEKAKTARLKAYHDDCHRPYLNAGLSDRRGEAESKFKLYGISRHHVAQVLNRGRWHGVRPELPEPQLLYGIWKTASGKEYMFTRTYAIIYARHSATAVAYRVADSSMTIDYEDKDVVEIVTNGCAEHGSNVRFFDDRTPAAQRTKEIEMALSAWGITRVPLIKARNRTIWGEVFVSGRPYPFKP